MNRFLFSVILSTILCSKISATGDSTKILLPHDSVYVIVGEFPEKIIIHTIAKKQTLYSIARHYGLEIEELGFYNPTLAATNFKIGETIKIPIPNQSFRRFKKKKFIRWKYAPVYYKVRPGETMFTIAKMYFDMPVDSLKSRNKYWNNDIAAGMILQVAWLPTAGVPDSLQKMKGHPLWRNSQQAQSLFAANGAARKLIKHAGPSAWPKQIGPTGNESFILHNTAPIGEILAISNPMNNRVVYAKCIGRIPKSYPPDTKSVVSPSVAKLLAIQDERFYSIIKYYK